MDDLTVALLAGGQSARMGQDKALIPLAGRPLIAHILERVRPLAPAEILLIANAVERYAPLGLPCLPDDLPGKGPLGGLYTALRHSTSPHTLVIACDLPLIRTELLRYLQAQSAASAAEAIVPRVAGRPQGLLAIYSRACQAPIAAALAAGQMKVIAFYAQISVRYLDEADYAPYDPLGRSFFNVNTPEDLAIARQLLDADRAQGG